MPERINIVRCIRYHMEGLWKLHKHIMDSHGDIPASARVAVSASIERYEAETSDDSLGLNAVAYKSEHESHESIPLLLNWDDARIVAERRIGNLNNLHKRYVSGKNQ